MADVFGKRHDNMLSVIRQIDEENQIVRLSSFAQSSYINTQNKEQPFFEMTETGFVSVIGRFNDQKDTDIAANSLNVAEVFGKNHFDVLDKIDKLECSQEFRDRNFAVSSYVTSQNREQKMYEMTRDGFSFLVMGFTGGRPGGISRRVESAV